MYLPKTSKQDVLIPVYGPEGFDFTPYPVQVALMPDDGSEPGETDWVAATWASNGVATIKVAKGQYPDSSLFAWVTFDTTDEAPVIPSGRIRVGNGGS